MEHRLRTMTMEDVQGLAAIEQSCFSDAWSETLIRDLPDSSWDEVYVLETADRMLIGYINYRFIAGEGELMRIAVLPEYRGRGLSRILMDAMMKAASENEIAALTLEVRAGNTPAIGLYQAYGFVGEAVRKNYYHNPTEDALIMWLRGLPSISS